MVLYIGTDVSGFGFFAYRRVSSFCRAVFKASFVKAVAFLKKSVVSILICQFIVSLFQILVQLL